MEENILIMQETMEEDCASCPYKGEKCKSQCMEKNTIINPNLNI